MLVIKIELHSAITHRVTTIHEMIIYNKGGTKQRGDYRAMTFRSGKSGIDTLREKKKPLRDGEVIDYPRLSLPVWSLIKRALENLGY